MRLYEIFLMAIVVAALGFIVDIPWWASIVCMVCTVGIVTSVRMIVEESHADL